MNDSQLSPEHSNDGCQPDRLESFNGPNVVTVIVEGAGDNTIRPAPPELLPYLRGFVPRPQKPPQDDN